MITYANTFDSKFALWLRAEKPRTLLAMQEVVVEVQSNLLASNKLKVEEGKEGKNKGKMKEEKQPSSSKAFTAEEKLDEMSNLINHLASKMSKLEVDSHSATKPIQDGGNRNQAPYRKPFQPQQIMQCPRRNLEDQNVQPPLNNFAGENKQEEDEERKR